MRRAFSLTVLFSVFAAVFFPVTILAQSPETGRFALYADSLRTSNEIDGVDIYVPFEVYLFCQPGQNGMTGAEFALRSTTASLVATETDWHPSTTVVLGSLSEGISVGLLDCQTDWLCLVRLTMINTGTAPTELNILRHPASGYYQFATCESGHPLEPVFNGPSLCVNMECPPDTDPPVPVDVVVEDDRHLEIAFDEEVFEPDGLDLSSYFIHRTGAPEDSIPVVFTLKRGYGERYWLVLERPMNAAPYTVGIRGIRDIAGNPAPPGTEITFAGMDNTPPELINAYAPDDVTVVLEFSEMLGASEAEDRSNYSISDDRGGSFPQPDAAVLQPGLKSVHLTLEGPMAQDVIYEVTVSGVKDIAGNAIDPPESAFFKPPDTTPPYILSHSLPADTVVSMLWNEELDPVTAADISNFLMVRDGPPEEPMTPVSTDLLGGKLLRLSFGPAVEAEETYSLYISGVMDTSMNVMLDDTLHIVPQDTIPPSLSAATCIGTTLVDLEFTEPVDLSNANCSPCFDIYPAGQPWNGLTITGISIPGDSRVIRLESSFTPGTDYTVVARNITDPAGNFIPEQSKDFTCEDTFPPKVDEIYLPDMTHLNVVFNEPVNAAAADPATYIIREEADTTALIGVVSAELRDGGGRAELETAPPFTAGALYRLRMTGIGDLVGNMIHPDSSWTFIAEDTVDPVLTGLSVTSDSIVHLEFDEPLDPVTAEDITKYEIVDACGVSGSLPLLSAVLDSSGTLVDLNIDGHASVTACYRVWINGVTDVSGNDLYTQSDLFEFIDDRPPELISVEGISTRAVTVRFSEVVTGQTATGTHNYDLHAAGDPSARVDIFRADHGADRMSADLVLSEDLVQHGDYTLVVAGIEDPAGHTMAPDSADFNFVDERAPVILDVSLDGPTSLSVRFNEPVDSVMAGEPMSYSVYMTALPSSEIEVTSADWAGDVVTLGLGAEPQHNVDYTVRAQDIEDRFGNVAPELFGYFRREMAEPTAVIALYIDDERSSNEIETVTYETFIFYVWVRPGDNGVHGVAYSVPMIEPINYICTGFTVNPHNVSSATGSPCYGHSVSLSTCASDWFWVCAVECLCLVGDEEEVVWAQATPEFPFLQAATCLEGNPVEPITVSWPLLMNVEYVGIMLDSWDVSYGGGGITLSWSIQDTDEPPGFVVSRTAGGGASDGAGEWLELPADLVRGSGLEYSLVDTGLEAGISYMYRVEYLEAGERKILFETDAVEVPAMPLVLHQNSPNPFNPSTAIGFFLPQAGRIRLEVFDVNGRLVRMLADGNHTAGEHSIEWDGTDRGGASVSSGVYFYRLIAGKESLSRKMVLLR